MEVAQVTTEQINGTIAPAAKPEETKTSPDQSVKAEEQPQAVAKEEAPRPDFKLLARKEKEIFRKRQEIKNYEQNLLKLQAQAELREKQAQDRERKLQDQETLWKSNPLEALKSRGWSYEDLTNFVLTNKVDPTKEVMSVKQELEAFKQQQIQREQEKERQSKLEAKRQAEIEAQQVIESYRETVNNFIDQNKDKYELMNIIGEKELPYAIVELNFQQTGKIMSNDEACDIAEKYLEDLVLNATKAKKLATKLNVSSQTSETKTKEEPKTLNNNMTASAGPSFLPAKSENERIQRALAALEGKR